MLLRTLHTVAITVVYHIILVPVPISVFVISGIHPRFADIRLGGQSSQLSHPILGTLPTHFCHHNSHCRDILIEIGQFPSSKVEISECLEGQFHPAFIHQSVEKRIPVVCYHRHIHPGTFANFVDIYPASSLISGTICTFCIIQIHFRKPHPREHNSVVLTLTDRLSLNMPLAKIVSSIVRFISPEFPFCRTNPLCIIINVIGIDGIPESTVRVNNGHIKTRIPANPRLARIIARTHFKYFLSSGSHLVIQHQSLARLARSPASEEIRSIEQLRLVSRCLGEKLSPDYFRARSVLPNIFIFCKAVSPVNIGTIHNRLGSIESTSPFGIAVCTVEFIVRRIGRIVEQLTGSDYRDSTFKSQAHVPSHSALV